jgi:dipeptidyl aminopeptidase/acylaminoacyl peptidase
MTLNLSIHDEFLDRLLRVPQLYGARISPDGQWVAWIWAGIAETTQLWIAAAGGIAAPRPLVADSWDCDSFRWTPDSLGIVYGRSKDGDERVGLHLVHIDGRPSRALTEDRPDYYIHGGQLAADNRTLIFAANVDPETCREIEPSLIYRQDAESGARRVLARPERAHFAAPVLSPDNRHVLYDRNDLHPGGNQLWLTDIDASFDREIVNVGTDKKADGMWSPDGKAVLLTAETETHRKIGLWRLGGNTVDWLIDDPDRPIADAVWPRRAEEIIVEETRDARPVVHLLHPVSRRERLFGPFPDGQLTPVGPLADGAWLAWHYDARHPVRLVRVALEEKGPRILADLSAHPGIAIPAPAELTAAEDFRWSSADGTPIQGWLYRAKVGPGEAAIGTILDVHGGPTGHDEDMFGIDPQYFARCGFNVLQPNYRGSTGFSLQFQEAVKKEGWGGAEQVDIRTGAEALIRAGIAAPGKVGITGTSYGGYSSWWAITHDPTEVIAAAAPICGMTDLVVDYETTRPDLRPYSEEMMGGTPETAPDRFRDRSPIHFIENIKGRLLIIQGANDPNVTPQNVADVRARLDAARIPYDVLIFADEGHGIAKPSNRKTLLKRLAGFFADAFA